jgi:hypothetical protein
MNEIVRIGTLSPQDLMALGLEQIAYIRPIEIEGDAVFAVHAADGTQIAILKSRDLAVAAIQHHELEAMSVH